MSPGNLEIVACPPAMSRDALALVMTDLTSEQRRDFAPAISNYPVEALMVALEDGDMCGAAWGQRQPGSTAMLWPPRFVDTGYEACGLQMIEGVCRALDSVGIRMTQVLLQDAKAPLAATLQEAGFSLLTELLYLNWDATVEEITLTDNLDFELYRETSAKRLAALVEETYEATHDCPALGGQRPMEEVLAGYRATGDFHPDRWLFVRESQRDVGVLLLTDHSAANHWELLYIGLVPAARGRRLGSAIVRQAQALAYASGAERIVLAVDAENSPAIKMYNDTGFHVWDRRTVFVRFARVDAKTQNSS